MSEVNKQRLKEYQTSYRNAEKKTKKFWLFFITWYKNKQKVMVFSE